jgi:dephospho-CoA kinase
MKFRDFLTENKNSTIVAAFGRFNVPTIGHGLLAKKVVDTAKSVKADHIVYASRTQDAKKNPLDVDTKVKYLKKMFPGINFKAANEDVRTFIEMAAKLSAEGYKNLVMIAGSDRIDEYQKLLDKYNGKDFKFNSIKVVSAGERDPDADGAAGMSGTKMREAAIKNDFKAFRSGIPKTLSDKETKELMEKVRKIMVKEEFNVDEAFTQILTEGVHDKAIFKAVFLAGGPGSGKDYVLDNTLAGHGLTEINSDKALEFLMDKEGLDKTMPAHENEKKDIVRGRAKNITELRQKLALLGRNGLIINGTGDDVEKITKIKKKLEELGYDSSMIAVNTADEVSKQRNIERGQRGGRTVPEHIRKEKWDSVQAGRAEFAKMFGPNYMEFDNSEDLRKAPPEVVKAKKEEMLQLFTNVKNFVAAKPTSDAAKEWIASELDKKDTLKVPKGGAEKVAHADSGAAEEARKLGLQYYGFGRYGQKGVVTHRSVHDSLVEIPKDKPKETTVPISGSSMRKPELKKVNEDFELFLNESVTVSITGDTPQEVQSMLSSFNHGQTTEKVEEEETVNYMSDPSESLTLGKTMEVIGQRNDGYVITNADIQAMFEEQKVKLLRGHNGKPKIFLLRRSAAKESHIHGGTVMKHPNGYVIKIKEENDNVNEITQLTEAQTKNSRSGARSSNTGTSSNTRGGLITESYNYDQESASEKSGTKITLAEIRKRKEAQVKESIDMGIEPGISMAASGENLRSTVRKKRIEELTGDETTLSNSAEVEGELKRKGINLKSFKASRYGTF